jgi:hypothetical protein
VKNGAVKNKVLLNACDNLRDDLLSSGIHIKVNMSLNTSGKLL